MSTGGEEEDSKQHTVAPSILRSWTPTTTQQLQDASSCAFDVLDHAIEGNNNLQAELAPWKSQLKPARTQGDVQAAEILSLLQGIDTTPTTSRGDVNIFISREARNRKDFKTKCPFLSQLISSVENTAEQHLTCITFDKSLTSVQLAVYPGDGTSGYPKHCDRSKSANASGMQRIVTAVYYVTPEDWNADLDGGCLRVFTESDTQHYDVVPYSNRMVVFRSDIVNHQVLPSFRRERMALTIWLYGKVNDDSNVVVPKRQLAPTANNKVATASDETTAADTLPPPLPITDNTDVSSTIFVSIAAYRDSELGPTLCSLMATAQYPKRVFVGVVLQLDETADESILDGLPREEPWFQTNIKMLTLEACHSRGPCYARDLGQRLYQEEDYVLQTDSHMRFRPNWDSYLIQQLSKCPNKSMLTTYPVGYKLRNQVPDETRATLLVPWKFDDDGMLRQRGRLLQPRDESNVACHLYAAGFNFASGDVITDVPYDGRLQYLFFGEELSMAVRLYTHGYNLYAPPQTVVYHLWSRSHRPTSIQETVSPEAKRQQETMRKAARQVVLQQLRGEGRGLGTERTVAEFAEAIGVDFRAQTIDDSAALGGLEASEFANDSSTALAPDSVEGQVASLDVKTQARIMSFLAGMNS